MYDEQSNEQVNPIGKEYLDDADNPPSDQPDVQNEISYLKAELDKIENEKTQFHDMAQRLQADFLNFKRRTEEERKELQKYAGAYIIVKLLPVLDEFELAIDHANKTNAEAQWLEGVRLIHRKLSTLLESYGVERVEALGKEFDPFEHEALGEQESSDTEPGHIVAVARDGYRLYERILRPAQVIVAKKTDQPTVPGNGLVDKEEK